MPVPPATWKSSESVPQIYSPTSLTQELLLPESASTSTEKIHNPKSVSTSREKFLHPNSANSSSTKLLAANSASTSRISLAHAHTHPYGPRTPVQKRRLAIDERVLALSVTITLAILLLIGIPLGAILPPKYVVELPVNILVPFYVSPDLGAWDRLYDT